MRIVVFKGKKGHWYFHVVARNNKIVAASEGYTSKRNAYKSIDLMRREMSDAEVEELE